MKLREVIFKVFFLFGILAMFSSCNGQAKPKLIDESRQVTIGKKVSELNGGITIIFQDKNNNHWFGGKGVYKFNGENLILYTVEDGLCSNAILGIQEDQFGNIYFDTSEGVCFFDGEKFTTLKVLESNSSNNEWKLEPNDLWFRIGWDSNGPFRYDGEILVQLELPKTEQADKFYAEYPNASFNPYGIYSLYKDSKGAVWIGTSSLGVCRYDGESISWLYEEQMTMTPSGGSLGIRSTLEDQEGHFWFTNTRFSYEIMPGISEHNGTSYMNYKKEDGIGYANENGEIEYPYFMSIVEDNNGDLWMATYEEGVWRNDGKKLIHYPIKDGEKSVLAFSIYKDNQGVIWLGTHNAGVYKFNGDTFEKFEPFK
jgi:ligand-binding sensor domain-containing protein